jgi:hypothetical protein
LGRESLPTLADECEKVWQLAVTHLVPFLSSTQTRDGLVGENLAIIAHRCLLLVREVLDEGYPGGSTLGQATIRNSSINQRLFGKRAYGSVQRRAVEQLKIA